MAEIYVGTYAKYNDGNLSGAWLDCEDYPDHAAFIEACQAQHSDESDPELMFQDSGGFPRDFYNESSIDSRLWDFLALDTGDQEIVTAWLSENSLSKNEDLQSIVDSFTGRYASWADYAEEITTECNKIPDYLQFYIDWEKMGRDISYECAGYVEYEGELWLFDGR